MGSMYRWFEAYQDEHFPDPMGLRAMAHKWSLGLYPGIIKVCVRVCVVSVSLGVWCLHCGMYGCVRACVRAMCCMTLVVVVIALKVQLRAAMMPHT